MDLEDRVTQLEDQLAEVELARVCAGCGRLELPPGNHACA